MSLREWRDNIFDHEGERYIRVWWLSRGVPPARAGGRARLEHLEWIRAGAPGYIVVVGAQDVDAQPRVIAAVVTSRINPV